jgi:ABC-type dipeptide/oligopeptide/nickel transport system ATPase component
MVEAPSRSNNTAESEFESAPNLDYFVPRVGQRMFIAGQSGAGKTYFLEHVLTCTPERQTVVHDVKAEFNVELFAKPRIAKHPNEVRQMISDNVLFIVYQPLISLCRNFDANEDVLRYCFDKGNIQVAVDELYSLRDLDRPQRFPPALFDICTRGRSREITGYFGAQRPFRIPIEIMSESRRVACFELAMPDDRKRMAEITGKAEFLTNVADRNIPDRSGYEFLYYNKDDRSVTLNCLD